MAVLKSINTRGETKSTFSKREVNGNQSMMNDLGCNKETLSI